MEPRCYERESELLCSYVQKQVGAHMVWKHLGKQAGRSWMILNTDIRDGCLQQGPRTTGGVNCPNALRKQSLRRGVSLVLQRVRCWKRGSQPVMLPESVRTTMRWGLLVGSILEGDNGTLSSLLPTHDKKSIFLSHNKLSNNELKVLRAKITLYEPRETLSSWM